MFSYQDKLKNFKNFTDVKLGRTWEYFGRCVANCTSSSYQACNGVQLKITINFIRACLLELESGICCMWPATRGQISKMLQVHLRISQ